MRSGQWVFRFGLGVVGTAVLASTYVLAQQRGGGPPQPMTFFHDFATFRGRGCTDVVYSVAAPAARYQLTLAIADTFTWDAQSIDTVMQLTTRGLRALVQKGRLGGPRRQ